MEFMNILITLATSVAFAIIAPIIGCLLAGLDRVLSARLQGRVGPPLLQPYYDVRKLFAKEKVTVNSVQDAFVICSFIFACLAGGIFFSGGNLLMVVFIITLSGLFFIIAAYSSRSPYAEIGANRETIQVMAYEPMVLIFAVGFYMATQYLLPALPGGGLPAGSFNVGDIFQLDGPIFLQLWIIFIGLIYILTIKLRKSPFDISMSHHAHQEIVRGMTTEMSGSTLAIVEITHWCETVLFLGWIAIFFIWGQLWTIALGIAIALIVFLFEIIIDNNFARVKWQYLQEESKELWSKSKYWHP